MNRNLVFFILTFIASLSSAGVVVENESGNLVILNKTKSDVKISYVICTYQAFERPVCKENSTACSSTDISCEAEQASVTIPAQSNIKNPFPVSMAPYPLPPPPYSFTTPSVTKIESLNGGFNEVHFLSVSEHNKICDSLSSPSEWRIRWKECDPNFQSHYNMEVIGHRNTMYILDDEDVGILHITSVLGAGVPQ